MTKEPRSEDELTSVEEVGLLTKWVQLLRLNIIRRGFWYGVMWLSDLIVRLTVGASPERFSNISDYLHVGGQYLPRGWRRLKNRGVNAVINMRSEFDDAQAGIAPAQYLHLPTVDNTAPRLEDLREGVEFIERILKQGGEVYVHCEAGVGRAPTMAAAYLVSQGMKPTAAWDLLRDRRPFIRPTLQQVEQIEEFALLYSNESANLVA